MRKILLALALAAALAAPAMAKEDHSADDQMGVGIAPCAEFAKTTNHVQTMMYYSWAQGFITAANWSRLMQGGNSVNVSALSQREQLHRLHVYCEAHPLTEFMYAVGDLINGMPTNPGSADEAAKLDGRSSK